MSIKYKFWDADAIYFVTFAVVEWIDILTRDEYREIIAGSICHCIEQKGLVVHAWVIMSNHVHLLISLKKDAPCGLSDIMRDMKKYTAMQIIKYIRENEQESRRNWLLYLLSNAGKRNSNNTNFQLWQQDNHPILMKDDRHCLDTLTYIHNNSIKAGLVREAIHYIWSSAIDYTGGKGNIPVKQLDLLVVR
jgi:putative transposase